MSNTIIQISNLCKSYQTGEEKLEVLRSVSFDVQKGDFVALTGASGSGKSTLLNCIGLLSSWESGQLNFCGEDCAGMSESRRAQLRLEQIGFIFQFHHLIPELKAWENVYLPAALKGEVDVEYAHELLKKVGLGTKADCFPWQLSGGEQQRVAIARALVNSPALLLTDEATGNLDRGRSMEIFELLQEINQRDSITILSVTHDEDMAECYSSQLRLSDGQIVN